MDKTIFFLSGLPRSGSTLLGSLIGQREDFTVTPTSPFLDLLCYIDEAFLKLNKNYTFDKDTISNNVYKRVVEGYFENIETKYILDKHRGHPRNVVPLKMFANPNPKIVCTVRPVSEIITSYITLIEKNKGKTNFIDEDIIKNGMAINNTNRAKVLWENYISDPYASMVHGLKNNKENLFLVEYKKLVDEPESVLNKIYEFLGVGEYNNHNFNNIKNKCSEDKDFAWGLDGLHEIRSELKKVSQSPKDVIGSFLASKYDEYNLL
jgi:sulfotransferase